ncbi:hypothetical protein KAJ27_02025 [bacterium]|nr:hypothetical protein [bacterium]
MKTSVAFICILIFTLNALVYCSDYISIDVKGATLGDVFSTIAKYAGKNIILKGNLSQKITLSITDTDYRHVLRMLAFSHDLTLYETRGIILVRGKNENPSSKDKVTRIFRLQYANADEVAGILKSTFKNLKEFSVSVDKRNNAVIVSCLRSDISFVERAFP